MEGEEDEDGAMTSWVSLVWLPDPPLLLLSFLLLLWLESPCSLLFDRKALPR